MRLTTVLTSCALFSTLAATPAFAQTMPAIQSTQKYEIKTTGAPQFYSNNARATSQVIYNAGTQTYTIRDTGSVSRTASFGPGQLVSSAGTHTIYTRTASGTTETFRVYNKGQVAAGQVNLTYSTYGHWRESTPGAGFQGATKLSDTYFIFGTKTTAANMPRSGSAGFNGIIDGTFVNKTSTYTLGGTIGFTADWTNAKIGFTALATASAGTGSPTFGPIVGANGPINFNGSSFSANGTDGTYQMNMNGLFFGPAANELGAVFRLSGNGGTGNGAIVAKQ
ncbi:MAG: Transferrin binding protein-like solute binding protein [Alphaproteobacteria bacterium]|nr:Transferrin binding protein-like solute binding protein [Alphaproteobacteria bacterium]